MAIDLNSAGRWMAGLAAAAAIAAALPAQASQTPVYWRDSCSSCHGSPVQIAGPATGTPQDNRLLTQRVNVGGTLPSPPNDNWLSSATALGNHIRGFGGEMATVANGAHNADLELIRQYLVDIRDSVVTSSVQAFPATAAGTTSTTTRTVQIANSRFLALGFSVAITGTNAGDFLVSGCGVASGTSGNGTVGAATAGSGANAGLFAPATCSLTVTFRPQAVGTGTSSAQLGISFSGNEGGNPAARTLALSGSAVAPLAITSPAGCSPTADCTSSFTTTSPDTTASNTITITDRIGSAFTVCLGPGSPLDGVSSYSLATDVGSVSGQCVNVPSVASASTPRPVNVTVTFSPGTVTTPLNAVLQVQGLTGQVQLRGNAGAVLVLSTTSLFDADSLEADGNVSVSHDVTVSNGGNQALTFTSGTFAIRDAALSGDTCGAVLATNSAQYSIAANSCGASLPAYAGGALPSCTVTVRFDPSDVGRRCGALTIGSSGGTQTIALSGQGFHGPRLILREGATTHASGDLIDFTSQRLGTTSAARTFTLTNGGTQGSLALLLPAPTALAGYTLTPDANCAQPLPALGVSACTLTLTFSPTQSQTYAGTLDIRSRDAGAAPADPYADLQLNLTGQGTDRAPALTWRDAGSTVIAALDFGSTTVGMAPVERHVFLNNAGPGAAQLQFTNLVGTDASNYQIGSSTCGDGAPLGESAMCEIVIRFAPGSAGSKSAVVQVASDGNGPGLLTLSGTASAAASANPLVVSNPPAFTQTAVGSVSLPVAATLTNAGTAALSVTGVSTDGPFRVLGSDCPPLPFVLLPAASCQVNVVFAPTSTGPQAGALRVASDSSATSIDTALAGDARDAPDVATGGGAFDPTLSLLLLLAFVLLRLTDRGRRRSAPGHQEEPRHRKDESPR